MEDNNLRGGGIDRPAWLIASLVDYVIYYLFILLKILYNLLFFILIILIIFANAKNVSKSTDFKYFALST